MYLIAFPLLLIPFVLYNMIIFLLNMPFSEVVFSIPLLEGRRLLSRVSALSSAERFRSATPVYRRWL